MQVPERFSDLPEYAFPRLRALLDGAAPGGDVLAMSIGEPRHPMPDFVRRALADGLDGFSRYPANNGTPELLEAIAGWINRRYGVAMDPARQIMVLNGTREGLFNAALATFPEEKAGKTPVVLIPNPFYQVYAVAALETRAEPVFVPATAETGYLPDFASLPPEILERTVAAYICSPSNPQGAVADGAYWKTLLDLAEAHDFRVFADECYSEIYRDTPPMGVLEAAKAHGTNPERVLAFHSLSKRSSLPGLRSGFVAGGPETMALIHRLRAYAGAPVAGPVQAVSTEAWADEEHVNANRALYRAKYRVADEVFADVPAYRAPEAGFFLWLPVGDGEAAAAQLWSRTGVRVLPGAYLSRAVGGEDPGRGYIRVALVAPESEVARGLRAVREELFSLGEH